MGIQVVKFMVKVIKAIVKVIMVMMEVMVISPLSVPGTGVPLSAQKPTLSPLESPQVPISPP